MLPTKRMQAAAMFSLKTVSQHLPLKWARDIALDKPTGTGAVFIVQIRPTRRVAYSICVGRGESASESRGVSMAKAKAKRKGRRGPRPTGMPNHYLPKGWKRSQKAKQKRLVSVISLFSLVLERRAAGEKAPGSAHREKAKSAFFWQIIVCLWLNRTPRRPRRRHSVANS